MGDWIPTKDLELQVWMDTFLTYLSTNLAHFGLVAADVLDLTAASPEFSQARVAAEDARIVYKGLVSDKGAKRDALVDLLRPMVARLQTFPATTNQDRDSLGIPRRGGTSAVPQAIELLPDRPVAGINIGTIRRHTLRIQNDIDGTITSGKPEGVKAVEVWVKVGEAPTGEPETDMRYVNMSTKNTLAVAFAPEDGNKQAHYKMRWIYNGGQKGGWSELQSATIAA